MKTDPIAFKFVRDVVFEDVGIVLTADQDYLVEVRLGAIFRRENLDGIRALVERLAREAREAGGQTGSRGSLRREVVEAFTTNETSFFRDPSAFHVFQTAVLPELLAARAHQRSLNIWSAACSSGQEVFTTAMILDEHFPALARDGWQLRLYATDFSAAMVERVRQGRFTQFEVNRGLPAQLLVRYFHRDGLDWIFSENLRQQVFVSTLNLLEPFPAYWPKLDVVFLRNVLIYFDDATKTQILERVHRMLQPDGYLILGAAETPTFYSGCFGPERHGANVVYRPVPAEARV